MKRPRRIFRERRGARAAGAPEAPPADDRVEECTRRAMGILHSLGYGWHGNGPAVEFERIQEDARAACIVAGALIARAGGASDADGPRLGFELARVALSAMAQHWNEHIAGMPRPADPGQVAWNGAQERTPAANSRD